MTDDTQTEGNDAFARMVKLMLNTDFTYVMRLVDSAEHALRVDQELGALEIETKAALWMVHDQVIDATQALQAVIDFQREHCAQQKEAD